MDNYYSVVNQAIELCVETAEYSGVSFLQPRYREVLRENGLFLGNEEDSQEELYEILKLEVEKRNAENNRITPLLTWVDTIVNEVVTPAEEQEQNELIKNLLEYMKLNEQIKEREKDVAIREIAMDNKEKLATYNQRDFSFAERDRQLP